MQDFPSRIEAPFVFLLSDRASNILLKRGSLASEQRTERRKTMRYVQAYITNITFPNSLEELHNYGRPFDDVENALGIISDDEFRKKEYCRTVWTSPRWAKQDDVVFFYYGKTANEKIRHLKRELVRHKEEYDETEYWFMMNHLNRVMSVWKEYGGKIFAVGKVSSASYAVDHQDEAVHWKSRIYAPVDSVFVLEKPIEKAAFENIVKISQHGAVTPVLGNNFSELKKLILKKNKNIWDYFREAEPQTIPFSKLTNSNWLTVGGIYRRKFIIEAQFRAYYVDYLLPLLGDVKKYYKECECRKNGCISGYVDNAILFCGMYLPIEVKLNIDLEKNLTGQLDKYMHVDEMHLTEDTAVSGETVFPYVLVVDTESVFVYDGHSMKLICMLDELTDLLCIEKLRKTIMTALNIFPAHSDGNKNAAGATPDISK